MPVRRAEFHEAHLRACRVQRVDDVAAFGGGVEPVGIEADQTEPRLRSRKGVRQLAAVFFGDIVIIHRAGDIEIGVRVEAIGAFWHQ